MSRAIVTEGDALAAKLAAGLARLRAALVRRAARAVDDPTLASGAPGLALALHYLCPEEPAIDALLSRASEAAPEDPIALMVGMPGLAWVLAHTGRDGGGVLDDVEQAWLELVRERRDWRGGFELVTGLAGLGVYALERAPAGHALLTAVSRALVEAAEVQPGGVAWQGAPPRALRGRLPGVCFDLGIAHGAAGAATVLMAAVRVGVDEPRALEVADRAAAWVLARTASATPACVAPGDSTGPELMPDGWCRGAAGIAAALLAASADRAPSWRPSALALAARVATRPVPVDAPLGLCHGAAGSAHLLRRLLEYTGDARLGDAARGWLAHVAAGIARVDEGIEPAGHDDDLGGLGDRRLLSGGAGVALVLAAAIGEHEPAWDRLLLASVR